MKTTTELKTLLNLVANFYMQLHQAHWNITGKEFVQNHEFFGDLYDDVYSSIDDIAENIRKLDSFVEYSPKSIDAGSILVDLPVTGDFKTILSVIINNNQFVINSLRSSLESAREDKLYDIENYLADRINMHNKHAWMLKAMEK